MMDHLYHYVTATLRQGFFKGIFPPYRGERKTAKFLKFKKSEIFYPPYRGERSRRPKAGEKNGSFPPIGGKEIAGLQGRRPQAGAKMVFPPYRGERFGRPKAGENFTFFPPYRGERSVKNR